MEFIHIRSRCYPPYYTYNSESKTYIPLTEQHLIGAIPGFRDLNEAARKKALSRYLKSAGVVPCGRVPAKLPNCKPYLDEFGKECAPPEATLREGAHTLLSIGTLFQNPEASWDLVATLLGGAWCTALRTVEPDYHPVLSISSAASLIEDCLRAIVRAAVNRKKWRKKRARIHREAVLDFRTNSQALPHRIQDFTSLKLRVRQEGLKPLRLPYPYDNSVALMIGASSAQLRDSTPYLEHSGLILLNCGSCDLHSHRISPSALQACDSSILEALHSNRSAVAWALEGWAQLCKKSQARRIIQSAKASFGPVDSRYVSVVLDPKKLNRAIRYQLLLTFLDTLEEYDLLTNNEASCYRTAVKDVYDPDPVPELPVRHAEDPDVFLETMRRLSESVSIAALDEPYHKSDKHLGAWRKISGVLYWVILEEKWAAAYRKALRSISNVDTTFLDQKNWARDLQRILVDEGLIKEPSSGARYRFDLCGIGKRDSTYVIAIPASVLSSS